MERKPQGEEDSGMDWRYEAVCRDEEIDPELFFPVGHSGPARKQAQEAKALCFQCPVASECLNEALVRNIEYGIWGGMTEDERNVLRKRQKQLAIIAIAVDKK